MTEEEIFKKFYTEIVNANNSYPIYEDMPIDFKKSLKDSYCFKMYSLNLKFNEVKNKILNNICLN